MGNTASMVLSALGGGKRAAAAAVGQGRLTSKEDNGDDDDDDDIGPLEESLGSGTADGEGVAKGLAEGAVEDAAEGASTAAGVGAAVSGDCGAASGAPDAEAARNAVNSHLLMANVSNLNSLWKNSSDPPNKKDVDSIAAQVQWLQEFCDHLVENSLTRSLARANEKAAAKEAGEKRKRLAEAKRREKAENAAAAAASGGSGAKRRRKKKSTDGEHGGDEAGEEMEADAEVCGEADSVELCGAFAQAEGGPPTPLDEPLPRELRQAIMGEPSSRRQIMGMLQSLRRAGGEGRGDGGGVGTFDFLEEEAQSEGGAHSGACKAMDVEFAQVAEGGSSSSSIEGVAARDDAARERDFTKRTRAGVSGSARCNGAGAIGDASAACARASANTAAAAAAVAASSFGADADVACPPTPLSPSTGFSFDVEDLLKIVNVPNVRQNGVYEVLQSPRGLPLVSTAASPPTRGPLEALWMTTDPVILQACEDEVSAIVEGADEDNDASDGGDGVDGATDGGDNEVVRVRLKGQGISWNLAHSSSRRKGGGGVSKRGGGGSGGGSGSSSRRRSGSGGGGAPKLAGQSPGFVRAGSALKHGRKSCELSLASLPYSSELGRVELFGLSSRLGELPSTPAPAHVAPRR